VAVAAPGAAIWTCNKDGTYSSWSGTSFSSPVVAGVAALVASANPALSNTNIVKILKSTADDLGTAGFDVYFGYGRVNANRAVQAAGGTAPADTPPTASITSPAGRATVSGAVKVSVSATDNVGVTKVELYADGLLVGTSTVAPASITWDTTKLTNGSHTLQARAYDAANNVGASASVTVTVKNAVPDTTAPVTQITAPANGAKISATSVTITVKSSDNVGVKKVELHIDGKLYKSSTATSVSFGWSTKTVTAGAHKLQSFAFDAAGNKGSSAVVTVYR
jgi:hypothetical protein